MFKSKRWEASLNKVQPDETLSGGRSRMIANSLVACVDTHDWVEDDGFNRMEFVDHYCCECGSVRHVVEGRVRDGNVW